MMEKRDTLTEKQTRFLPPFLKDGILNSAVLLSEGVDSDSSEQTKFDCDRETPRLEVSGREPVVNEVTESHYRGTTSEDVTTMTEKHNEDDEMVGNNAVEIAGEDSGLGRNELVLGRGEMLPSVVEEAEGGEEEGSTEVEGNRVEEVSSCEGDDTPDPPMDVIISSIGDSPSRAKLVLATSQDTSLDIPKRLAQTQSEGYSVEEGLVLRSRLDDWGSPYRQLRVPKEVRSQCLNLAHKKFGHRGRNKVYDAAGDTTSRQGVDRRKESKEGKDSLILHRLFSSCHVRLL